jgi:hypothetical protein
VSGGQKRAEEERPTKNRTIGWPHAIYCLCLNISCLLCFLHTILLATCATAIMFCCLELLYPGWHLYSLLALIFWLALTITFWLVLVSLLALTFWLVLILILLLVLVFSGWVHCFTCVALLAPDLGFIHWQRLELGFEETFVSVQFCCCSLAFTTCSLGMLDAVTHQ